MPSVCQILSASNHPFLPTCTAYSSCKCNVCVRQPPSLRSLASYTVFHITANISETTLTSDTLYHNYIHAVRSNLVPEDRLIPFTFPHLRCAFARGMGCSTRRPFHKTCVDLLYSPGTQTPASTATQRRRLLLACVMIGTNSDVMCAINHYSQPQNVCSANSALMYAIH